MGGKTYVSLYTLERNHQVLLTLHPFFTPFCPYFTPFLHPFAKRV
jgi:hypothetical protein